MLNECILSTLKRLACLNALLPKTNCIRSNVPVEQCSKSVKLLAGSDLEVSIPFCFSLLVLPRFVLVTWSGHIYINYEVGDRLQFSMLVVPCALMIANVHLAFPLLTGVIVYDSCGKPLHFGAGISFTRFLTYYGNHLQMQTPVAKRRNRMTLTPRKAVHTLITYQVHTKGGHQNHQNKNHAENAWMRSSYAFYGKQINHSFSSNWIEHAMISWYLGIG